MVRNFSVLRFLSHFHCKYICIMCNWEIKVFSTKTIYSLCLATFRKKGFLQLATGANVKVKAIVKMRETVTEVITA